MFRFTNFEWGSTFTKWHLVSSVKTLAHMIQLINGRFYWLRIGQSGNKNHKISSLYAEAKALITIKINLIIFQQA